MKKIGEDNMILPKDLLNDLEKGDRTMEMLMVPEITTNYRLEGLASLASSSMLSTAEMAQRQNLGHLVGSVWGGVAL